jgi:hypothetical protein
MCLIRSVSAPTTAFQLLIEREREREREKEREKCAAALL